VTALVKPEDKPMRKPWNAPLVVPECPAGWVTGTPDYVGIGAQRCGTSWWYDSMRRYPGIQRSPLGKEVHYFDKYWQGNPPEDIAAEYASLFPHKPDSIVGEWTPRYLADPMAIRQLKEAAPEAKLLVMFRDPVARYRSAIARLQRLADDRGDRVLLAQMNDAIWRGYYFEQLRHVFDLFSREQVLEFGRHPVENHGQFHMTVTAIRLSSHVNGVAKRHGEVSRDIWRTLWPDRPADRVPIGHVTNGVHIPTWLGGPMRELLDRHLGDDWLARAADPATWAPVADIPDADLWAVRSAQRAEFVSWVRGKSVTDRLGRDEPRSYVEAAAGAFDPDALTIGFARRLATYKRLHLLVRDADRAMKLLSNGRPVQLVLAGKAHPRDDEGKKMVQHLFSFKWAPEIGGRVVYLDDYDLSSAARMVRGCDVWLNLPRPPLEASGTSGMKSAVNGGLQLSVLDGWWAEGYDGSNGWALPGEEDDDHGAQDHRDAAELHRLLDEEVSREFYERDADGLPRAWLARVKRSLMTNGPEFSATRMVQDYVRQFYGAGAQSSR